MFLIIFAVAGDSDKFDFIYMRWKGLMLNKAYAVLRDRDLAQDAVSEAFIRAYKNLRKLDDPESGRTAAFLVMVVKNVSLTMLGKQAKTAVVDISEYDRADPSDLEESVLSDCTAKDMMKVIGGLEEDLKAPFLMRYAYDYSLKDIGRMLKITENNAAVRIHRAKRKLAVMLKAYAEA